MQRTTATTQVMQLIRFALIAGVLMFGAVAVVVHGQPSWKQVPQPPVVGYALIAVAMIAVASAVVLKGRIAREADTQRRVQLLLSGWAVGEGAGLFGAVLFLLTSQRDWYFIGLLGMACSFALLRARGLP